MKSIISLCVLIISSIQLLSQSYDDVMINPFWDFYSFNYLSTAASGRGFSGIASENDISGFSLNPASVDQRTKNQINVQYTYKTYQPWLKKLGLSELKLKQQAFSGSVGYGRKFSDKLQGGIVYNNPTGFYFNGGEFVKTDSLGNEIGRYDFYQNVTTHSFNIPIVYKFRNVKFGLNLNYLLSMYTIPGEVVTTLQNPLGFSDGNLTATTHYFTVHAGFVVSIEDKFTIGAKVITGGKSYVKFVYPDGTDGDQTNLATYPWKAGAGIQYSINKNIRFLADYNYTRTSMLENLKDRHDVHVGIEGNVDKSWTLRGGFFTLLDYRKDEPDVNWLDPVGEYDQFFITLGGEYTHRNFSANIALLTSEISSGIIKNSYINGGLTFNF